MNSGKFILTSAFFLLSVSCIAQRTGARTTTAKYKVPKLISMVSTFRDTMFVTPEEAADLVAKPLRIFDTKNTPYAVSSYQFAYRQIVTTEIEETGKPTNTTSLKASLFKTTPLPDQWISMLRERPRPGEELIFFDVIAKDAQGRVMYAPNIKLTIK